MEHSPPPFFRQGPSARVRLLFFAGLAIALLVIDARYQTLGVVRQVIGSALYPVQRAVLWPKEAAVQFGEYFRAQSALLADVQRLREERLELAQRLVVTQQRESENAQLRRLLDARARLTVKSLHAEILYDTRDPFSQRVVINRGSQHGLKPGMPVVDERGVLGQVVRTFPMTAEVSLVTDRDLSIPVQVLRSGLRAVAYGGPQISRMEVRFMAANADVVSGDVLVSSGIDGVYPAGIPVAKVESVIRGNGPFASITCVPVASVAGTPHVLVLLTDSDSGRPS